MERYHIYKLGIAIIFYAIYYRRATIVYALATQQDSNGGEYVYYQGVQGKPGVDFPVYARIPKTSFSCKKVESGYYADLETSCQVFHICNGGAKISFLCPNGTIFQQSDLICEWWFKVNCTNSPNYYSESAELLREGSWKRKHGHRKTPSQNRNSSRRNKPQYQTDNNSNRRSDLNNRVNDEDVPRNVDEKKKVDAGDRGGRKFKENYDNLNVRNELTDNDYGNSDEAQIPEETASFYKNNKHNVIESSDKPTTHKYANHKETYTEITQPKYYSTKGSQTIPPQTYSTNRIPLNDGKPFVVSTPKSNYNIQVNSFSSGINGDYNRGTTESFKYSPTVPPFTSSQQTYSTTVRPKIIVDSSESNGYVSSTSGIQNLGGDLRGSTHDVRTSSKQTYTTSVGPKTVEDSLGSNGYISSTLGSQNLDGDFGGNTHGVTPFATSKQTHTTTARTKTIVDSSESNGYISSTLGIQNGGGEFRGSTHDVSPITSNKQTYATTVKPRTIVDSSDSNGYISSTLGIQNGGGDLRGSTHDASPVISTKQTYATTVRPKITVDSSASNGYISSTLGIRNGDGDFRGSTHDASPVTTTKQTYATTVRSRTVVDSSDSNGHISSTLGIQNVGGDLRGSTHDASPITSTKQIYATTVRPNTIVDSSDSNGYISSTLGIRNGGGDFRGSTGSVTPFASSKQTYTTTVRPNIIVDSSEPSGFVSSTLGNQNLGGQFDGRTPDVTIHKSVYTTPNSNRIESNRNGGISFTERINTFSGLDDIVHTPTTSKYETNRSGGFDITDGYSNQRYETTTKDSYYPPVVYATSAKYGTESDVRSNGNNLGSSPNVPEISTNARSNHESTTNTNRNVGSFDELTTNTNNNQFETIRDKVTSSGINQSVPPNISSNKSEYEIPKVLSTINNSEPPSIYNDGNIENLSISSRNINNVNKENTIPNTNIPSGNGQSKNTLNPRFETTESSYGDACGDDIVYTELPEEQIVIGKQKIVIDDTSVPTTETNSIKLKVNNLQHDVDIKTTADSPATKAATDSTIFRINVKYGQDSDNASDRPINGFYVTKQSQGGFSNANTYLPTRTTTTESYKNKVAQTKSRTYLPNSATPAPFTLSENSGDFLKLTNKVIQIESNRVPQIRKTSAGVSQISEDIQKKFALRPKPFELPPKETEASVNVYLPKDGQTITGAPVPSYSVSSARPFSLYDGDVNTVLPTLATPYPIDDRKITEHLKNMLQTLKDIVNEGGNDTDLSSRQGLVVPPSVGPQTLHTLAVYFSNALDGAHPESGKDNLSSVDEAEAVKQLLTKMTLSGYHELFKGEKESSTTTAIPEENTEVDLEGQHTKTSVTPRVRQLAQVFTKALSSYLDDPDTFKKVLEEARPTEPSTTDNNGSSNSDDDELLNYSDADIKPHLPRLSTTTIAPVPTWGYILAPNNSNSFEHNSLIPDGENLQSADSQSFASQFNNYIKEKHFGKDVSTTPQNLPSDHWTSSDNATKLWQDKLYTNPQAINENLNVSVDVPVDSRESGSSESAEISARVNYGDLPKMDLNSTQVHKILVDIINSTKDEGGNKLKRILSKLNTTQEDFLLKMKEIEQNPLTRRLILLLISECGSNISHLENRTNVPSGSSSGNTASLFESSRVAEQDKYVKGSSPFPVYVDPNLKDEDQDNRALQLLNSLYTIASKYGK